MYCMALQKRITARKTPKYCKHYKKNKTGYSLERYDSVEEARNSDCDAVIVTDKDKIDNEETSILFTESAYPCIDHIHIWLKKG